MMRTTIALLLALLAVSAEAPARTQSSDAPARVTCAFSNPGYSGWCRATADVPQGKTGRDACLSILECLNNSQCTKSYCQGTETRGGWKLEKIEPAAK
jgi:hypothetical protein